MAKGLTGGHSYAVDSMYVMVQEPKGGRSPFNIDVIKALQNIWIDILGDEDEETTGQVTLTSHKGSGGYFTYYQEKQGYVNQTLLTFRIPKGYEKQAFAAVAKELKRFRFKVEFLRSYREPKVVKAGESKTAGGDHLWMRFGDVGDYEHYDGFDDAAEAAVEFGITEITGWTRGGFTAPGFEGHNYVSMYWGDADAEKDADLTGSERKKFERESWNERNEGSSRASVCGAAVGGWLLRLLWPVHR